MAAGEAGFVDRFGKNKIHYTGIKKKLEKISKKKLCKSMGRWSASISNHLYWCAASSEGNGELLVAKWLSVGRHAVNKHSGHAGEFPTCLHGPIEDGREWLKEGSKAHLEMMLILEQPTLLRDIKQLSPAEQTSSLESYHNICCHFAPKSLHFGYEGMKARLFLSALHFNENSNRSQAVCKDGTQQWRISYPKSRKGEAVAKEVKVPVTYEYVLELLDEVLRLRKQMPTYSHAMVTRQHRIVSTPKPVVSKYQKKEKMTVVTNLKSRFVKKY